MKELQWLFHESPWLFIHSNNISLLFKDNTRVGQINQRTFSFHWLVQIMSDNPLKMKTMASFRLSEC